MKLARYQVPHGTFVGLVDGARVVPVARDEPGAIVEIAMRRDAGPAIGDAAVIADVRLLSPAPEPPSIRDFYAFEQHVRTARSLRGLEVDPVWYEVPVFYFSNPATVLGPHDLIRYPASSQAWDYELEFAFVIGAACADAAEQKALDVIAGYTIFNDCSARDVQRREMTLSLGPSKGKDFASVLGPFLVTPDEFDPSHGGAMLARVNGVEYSRADLSDLHHSVASMVVHASRDSRLRAGDVFGSGTCGTGCILELQGTHGADRYPWLRSGDVVELEIDGLGVLRNVVG